MSDDPRYARVYNQLELETERYLRENTLCDGGIERYGFGKHILRMMLSGLAMHAMHHMMGGSGRSQESGVSGTQEQPSIGGGFEEKEHPRESMNAGGKQAGQFLSKPGGPVGKKSDADLDAEYEKKQAAFDASRAATSPAVQPSPTQDMDPHTAKVAEIWHGSQQGYQPHEDDDLRYTDERADKLPTVTMGADKPTATPWLAAPGTPTPETTAYDTDPRRGTPEQKAAVLAERQAKDQQAESPRNYPDNLGKPPEQQTNYAPPERTIEPTSEDLQAISNDPYYADPPQPPAETQQKPTIAKQSSEAAQADRERAAAKMKADAQSAIDAKNAQRAITQKAKTEARATAKRVEFDPSGWGDDETIDAHHATLQKPKQREFASKDDHKTATKAYNQQRGRQEAEISRTVNSHHVRDQALEHDLDHDELHSAVHDELKHAVPSWQRSEEARRFWTTGENAARDLNARTADTKYEDADKAGIDERATVWGRQFPDIAGHDESEWSARAHAHIKAGPQPKPSHHSLDFVAPIAKRLAEQNAKAATQPKHTEYHDPGPNEDGTPFSRKSLCREVDRYFKQAQQEFRRRRHSEDPRIWTQLDDWL